MVWSLLFYGSRTTEYAGSLTDLCLSTVLTSMSERDFIEGRRRALGRFINLVARHPFFSEDELVKTFLTFNGSVRLCYWKDHLPPSLLVVYPKITLFFGLPRIMTVLLTQLYSLSLTLRTFRWKCVMLARKWEMNSWLIQWQLWQRFVLFLLWNSTSNDYLISYWDAAVWVLVHLCCRIISQLISRPSFHQAGNWSGISTTAFTSCGTGQRRWPSAPRKMPLIC